MAVTITQKSTGKMWTSDRKSDAAAQEGETAPGVRKWKSGGVTISMAGHTGEVQRGLSLPAPEEAVPAAKKETPDYSRMPSSQLAVLRNQAQIDLDMDALNRVSAQLKERRAATGKQTFGDRASDTISGSLQSYGAGMVNTAGTAMDTLGAVNTRNRNYTTAGAVQAARDNIDRYRAQLSAAKTAEERERLETLIRSNENRLKLMGEQTEFQAAQSREAAEQAHALADRMQDDSAASIARAKEGLGELGQLAVDVGVAGTQMGMDALTAALTGGSALAPMAVRSFGGGAQEARRSGAGLDQQLLYGAGSAALSVGTEKISNIAKPFKKMFGQGAAETIAESLVKKFGENQAVQMMQKLSQSAAGRIALSAIGEGGEEVVEDVLQPFLKRATYDQSARFDAGETGRDFLVGAILGGLGGVPEAIGNIGSKPARNQTETAVGAETRAPAGVDAAQVQTGAQGVQAAPERTVQAAPVQQQKAAPSAGEAAVNENGLTALTEQERINLSSGKKNKIVSTFQEAVSFIQNALSDRQNVDRAYLGKIPEATARMVMNKAGVNIAGYNAVLPGDAVRHMFNHHGDAAAEAARGQTALTPETAARIPEILTNPDRVTLSDQTDRQGRQALIFEKSIGDYFITIQAVSRGTNSIQADTLYIRKRTPQDTVSNAGTETPTLNSDVRNVPPQGFSAETISRPAGEVNGGKTWNGGMNDGEGAGGTVAAEAGGGDSGAGSADGGAGVSAGGQGRVAGTGAGEPGGSLAGGPEARRRAEQRSIASRRQSRVNDLRIAPISGRELGISTGTEIRTVKTVPAEVYDEAMRSTAARYESLGYQVTYFTGFLNVDTPKGTIQINGAVENGRIFIQADHRQWTIDQIGDHELFHALAAENPGLVDEIREQIRERFSEEEFQRVFARYEEKYRGVYRETEAEGTPLSEMEIQYILEEIFADAYGEKNAFDAGATQYTGVVKESTEDRGLGRRGQETGAATDRTTGPPETERFSIGYDEDNRPFVTVEEDILDGVPREKWIDTVKGTLKQKFPMGVRLGNNTIKINSQTRREMTFSEYTKWLARNDRETYANKFRAANNADEIILASRDYINEGLRHERRDNIRDFARGTVQLRVGESDYTAEVIVGTTSGGDMLLYDIVNLQPATIKERSRRTVQPNQTESRRSGAPASMDSITQTGQESKGENQELEERGPRFSLDDPEYEKTIEQYLEEGEIQALTETEQLGKTFAEIQKEQLYRPEGMSDAEYEALNQKWTEKKAGQRKEARGDYEAQLERQAAEAREKRLRNRPREEFTGTPALENLGVKIENSVGLYENVRYLMESDRAARSVRREMRKAERRLHATEAERNFASGVAAGIYTQEDIPATMNKDTVLELADYYWAERAVSADTIRQQRSAINKTLAEKMETLFKDSDAFKPSRSIVLNNRTPERNMLRIFGDERGAEINAAIFDPVAANEAERIWFVNRMFDEVRTFKGRDGRTAPLTREERALVHQVIEGRAVEEMVAGMEMRAAIENAAENIRKGGDALDEAREFSLDKEQRKLAEKYARWLETQEAMESGGVDRVRVNNAVQKYGELFDLFYDGINDFLAAHGYDPIGFIRGYAPHLQPKENQTLLHKAFQSMGIRADAMPLPASIAGRTADYRPGKRWNPYFLPRNSDVTRYDIGEAFESYVEYMSDVLYHTDDIMRVRQAANYFRRTYAPEEIRNNLEWAEGLRQGSLEEQANFLRDNGVISKTSAVTAADTAKLMDEYVDKLYTDISDTGKYSEFVSYLDNYANILAGKQSMADRGWEYSGGRTVLNLGNKLTKVFARAQVAGNLSSALNQTAQLPQITAELGLKHTAKALWDMRKIKKGGWALESDFLTGKRGIDYLVMDTRDMVLRAMFKPAELMDGMISTIAVRGKYLQEIEAGRSHKEAMRAADQFGKSIMGSRTKGSKPLAFEAKNPVSQMLHIFQVEAVNQWEHLSQDLPRDFRKIARDKGEKAAARALAGVILKMLLSAFFLNRASEELYGGTPAPFDVLGLSANFIASGEGLTTNRWLLSVIDNGWEQIAGERLFNTAPEATLTPWAYEDFDWGAAAEDTGYNVSNDIPYLRNAAGMLGLGDQTLPIPDLYGTGKGIVSAIAEDGPLSLETGKALGSAAAEIMPGGRQALKSAQGVETVLRGGRFKGYGQEERLQYPVDGGFFDVVQATMFGRNGVAETRDFYASGGKGLSEKQTQVYKDLVKGGADQEEVYGAIQEYRKIGGDKSLAERPLERGMQERDVIRAADLTDRQKLKLYQGLTGADSRAEKFRAMMDAGLSWDRVMDVYDRYAEIDADGEMKASQQASVFARWVDGQGFSKNQAAEIKAQLKFYSIIPAQAERYEALSATGLDADKAFQVTNALAELEPEAGKETVSKLQQYTAIADMPLSEEDKEIALEAVMSESAYEKYLAARNAGIKTSMYCDFLKEIGGMEGDDRRRQVWRHINGLQLSREQKDALHLAAGYKESTLRDAPWH